jgi:hypothetical protein
MPTDRAAVGEAARRWLIEAVQGGGFLVKHIEGLGGWVEINRKKFPSAAGYTVNDVLNEMINRDWIEREPVNDPNCVAFKVIENGHSYARKVMSPRSHW